MNIYNSNIFTCIMQLTIYDATCLKREVVKYGDIAEVHEFVSQFENGYDTVVC